MSEEPIRKRIELDLEVDARSKSENRYQKFIDLAQAIDHWRPFPRFFLGAYIYILVKVVEWFMKIPEPNNAQAGLVSVVVGAGAAWFGLYVSTKGDGKKQ